MKTTKRIYYILTYTFFIYPPFIWGLVSIYRERNFDTVHLTSLWINLILLVVLVGVCALLINKKLLHFPTQLEQKYLLFGFIGNIIVYFYTFQNLMHIEDIVTIYLVLLLILGIHYVLIAKRFIAIELWILLPIFLVLDYLHWGISGCGWNNYWECMNNASPPSGIYVIYYFIVLPIIGLYGYKIYKLQPRDFFKYLNLVLVGILSILFLNIEVWDERFPATIGIMIPFFIIVDFIVSIVNKVYQHKTLIFYIRTSVFLFVFMMIGESELFQGKASEEMLIMMVAITYSSFGIVLLTSLLNVKEDVIPIGKEVSFVSYTEDMKPEVVSQYGQAKADHMLVEDGAYSIVAKHDKKIIGIISTYIKSLTEPLEDLKEAYIHILEVEPDYRNRGLATTLVHKTEKHFKAQGITQIRGWSSKDKKEAILLWKKLDYRLCPTTIHIEKKNLNVEGYYFVKKL